MKKLLIILLSLTIYSCSESGSEVVTLTEGDFTNTIVVTALIDKNTDLEVGVEYSVLYRDGVYNTASLTFIEHQMLIPIKIEKEMAEIYFTVYDREYNSFQVNLYGDENILIDTKVIEAGEPYNYIF